MSPRRRLLRWLGSFAAVNAALVGVIGFRYLWLYGALGGAVSWSYALVAYVGHMSALALLALSLARIRRPTTRAARVCSRTPSGAGWSSPVTASTPWSSPSA